MDIMCQYYDYWIYVQLPADSALCEDSTTNQTNDDYVNGRYSQSINQSHIESSLGPNLHGHTDTEVSVSSMTVQPSPVQQSGHSPVMCQEAESTNLQLNMFPPREQHFLHDIDMDTTGEIEIPKIGEVIEPYLQMKISPCPTSVL